MAGGEVVLLHERMKVRGQVPGVGGCITSVSVVIALFRLGDDGIGPLSSSNIGGSRVKFSFFAIQS